MPSRARLRVAVVGAGEMSAAHLRALRDSPHVEVVAVVDVDEAAARRRADEFGVARATADAESALGDAGVDVVDLVVPHSLHAPLAAAALRAGKHVLCEKPVALSLAAADELLALEAESAGRLLVKAYQRSMTLTHRVQRLLEDGALGTVYLATGLFAAKQPGMAQPESWRGEWDACGGGVLVDSGYHLLDLFIHLFGAPEAVTATCLGSASRLSGKAEDVAVATIELPGTLASVVCTWADTSQPFRWHRGIYGDEGAIEWEDTWRLGSMRVLQAGREVSSERVQDSWEQANRAAIETMIDDLRLERPSQFGLDAARGTLAAVLACYESSRSGRTVTLDDESLRSAPPPSAATLRRDLA